MIPKYLFCKNVSHGLGTLAIDLKSQKFKYAKNVERRSLKIERRTENPKKEAIYGKKKLLENRGLVTYCSFWPSTRPGSIFRKDHLSLYYRV